MAFEAGQAIISATGVVDVVKNYALSFGKEEFGGLWNLEEDIKQLAELLRSIQDAFEVVEKKQVHSKDILERLKKLKNVAYDMEDLLDECALEGLVEEDITEKNTQGKIMKWWKLATDSLCLVCDIPLSCFNIQTPVTSRREMAHRLQSISKSLKEIEEWKKNLPSLLQDLAAGEPSQLSDAATGTWWEKSCVPDKKQPMVGRGEAKEKIKTKLLACSSSNICVIGIVGARGMGKTTLAQHIFYDEEIEKEFLFRKWVVMGPDQFDPKRLILEIILQDDQEQMTPTTPHNFLEQDLTTLSYDYLQNQLINKIKQKRFLIVLDDAWCTDRKKWDFLWRPLTHGDKGGAIVVTTPNRRVPAAVTPYKSGYMNYLLEEMPDEECKEIFKRWAFKGESYRDLEGLCEWVVRKLKGVPLAAVVMGAYLGKDLCYDNWTNVISAEWTPTDEGVLVDQVVGLSYRHLPSHLKPCFAYCSIFPKGHVFDKDKLVQMWIAHGYVHAPETQFMEQTGSAYLEDLCQCSFFQIRTFESTVVRLFLWNDSVSYLIMHNLIHDFARRVHPEGCWMLDSKDYEQPRRQMIASGSGDYSEQQVRHLFLHCDSLESSALKNLHKFKKLRTLILKSRVTIESSLNKLAEHSRYVRVLDLHCYQIKEFPDSILQLKLLRYLDISETEIKALPEPACDLVKLQFLKLRNDCALAEGLSKLVNLRLLGADEKKIALLQGIGKLTSLQTLSMFHVRKESGCRIEELKNLNHLHSSLKIQGLENVEDEEEAERAKLEDKRHLERLVLEWSPEQPEQASLKDTQVLEGLCPPPFLKELEIKDNCGQSPPSWLWKQPAPPLRLPTWMREGLDRKQWPPNWVEDAVKMLTISLPEIAHHPRLVCVKLDGCCNWEQLPPFGQLPVLKQLEISKAHKVKKVGREFCSAVGNSSNGDEVLSQNIPKEEKVCFPNLETLSFTSMYGWEDWDMQVDKDGGDKVFPSLRELTLGFCTELTSLSHVLPHLTTLKKLTIYGCYKLASFEEERRGLVFPDLEEVEIV